MISIQTNLLRRQMHFEQNNYVPIGLFVKTPARAIGICRDVLKAVWLDANYSNADQRPMYPLNARWGDFEDVGSFIVRRQSKEYISGRVELVEEKRFR